MSFVNRQPDRFYVFNKFGNASSHIGKGFNQEFLNTCLQPLDYGKINEDLETERKQSFEWLMDAISDI